MSAAWRRRPGAAPARSRSAPARCACVPCRITAPRRKSIGRTAGSTCGPGTVEGDPRAGPRAGWCADRPHRVHAEQPHAVGQGRREAAAPARSSASPSYCRSRIRRPTTSPTVARAVSGRTSSVWPWAWRTVSVAAVIAAGTRAGARRRAPGLPAAAKRGDSGASAPSRRSSPQHPLPPAEERQQRLGVRAAGLQPQQVGAPLPQRRARARGRTRPSAARSTLAHAPRSPVSTRRHASRLRIPQRHDPAVGQLALARVDQLERRRRRAGGPAGRAPSRSPSSRKSESTKITARRRSIGSSSAERRRRDRCRCRAGSKASRSLMSRRTWRRPLAGAR